MPAMKAIASIATFLRRPMARTLFWAAGALGLWVFTGRLGVPDGPAGGLLAAVGSAHGWRLFLWLGIPLGLALSGLAGDSVAARAGSRASRPWRWAWLGFIALPLAALCAALDRPGTDWALAAGGVYLAALAVQTGLAGLVLWRATEGDQCSGLAAWGTGAVFLAFYLALALWTCQAVSTAGDETRYILESERLLKDLGLIPEHGVRTGYYWGRWSQALAWSVPQSPLMKWVLAPGVWLGGRLGAMAVLSVAGAAGIGLLVTLGRKAGFSVRASLMGAWALGGSASMMQTTQHLYPSALGVLGVCLGLWLVLRQGARRRLGLALAALTGVGMGLVKYRLATTGVGLVASAGAQWMWSAGHRRLVGWLAGAAGATALIGLALVLMEALLGWDTKLWRAIAYFDWWNYDPSWGHMLASLPAMLFDQQFGLFFYAPWLAVGSAGVWWLGRYSLPALAHTLWLAAVTVTPLVIYRWLQWDGGFTPPARFLAPFLPVLALWALPLLDRRAGRAWRSVCAGLIGLGWLIGLALALVPQWRYHRMTGTNNLLAWLGELVQSPVHRLAPSYADYFAPDMALALAWMALPLGMGLWMLWGGSGGERKWRAGDWLTGAGLVACGLALLALMGRTLPTASLEAESMQRAGPTGLHGAYFTQDKLLLLNRPGARGWADVVWPGGERRVVLVGFAVPPPKGSPQPPPVTLRLSLEGGGQVEAVLPVAQNWPEPHTVLLSGPPGWRRLEIAYVSGQSQVGVDRLLIR